MAQWVLRSKESKVDYFCIYNFRTGHMKRAIGLRFATVINEENIRDGLGKEIMDTAQKYGYPNLEWKRVDILLPYPESRGPLLVLTDEDREQIKKEWVIEK